MIPSSLNVDPKIFKVPAAYGVPQYPVLPNHLRVRSALSSATLFVRASRAIQLTAHAVPCRAAADGALCLHASGARTSTKRCERPHYAMRNKEIRSAPIRSAQALRAIKLMRIARMTRLISRFQYRLKLNPAYLRLGVTVRRPPASYHAAPHAWDTAPCGIRRASWRCAADVWSPPRPVVYHPPCSPC